ncbi:MAG: response regulator [Phycisphaerales bacterium]|nr:response regulator [Phycisphaerales bacterium]
MHRLLGIDTVDDNLGYEMLDEISLVDPTMPPRQQLVLAQLLTGASEKEVAKQIGISRHTVHAYVKAIYKRFDVTSRSQLIVKVYGLLVADLKSRIRD